VNHNPRPTRDHGADLPLCSRLPDHVKVSFEFFPPKTEKMAENLWAAVKRLEPLGPEFVSVTYGAGGSTRERTHDTVARIARETSLSTAAHLTCVDATREEVEALKKSKLVMQDELLVLRREVEKLKEKVGAGSAPVGGTGA